MRIVVKTEIPESNLLRQQWNALVQRTDQPQVFYTYEWALAMQRAYADLLKPLLLLVYGKDDSLIGLASLATDAQQQGSFLAGTTSDYCDFISAPQQREGLLRSAFAVLRDLPVKFLKLANLPDDSATSKALPSIAHAHGYSVFFRPAYFCAQFALGNDGQRMALKQSLSRRKGLRYALKRLAERGTVTLEHLTSCDQIEAALPSFFRAHVARFEAIGRTSNLATPERQTFLRELARLLSSSGWVSLSRFLVGDQPIAWNYGFRFSGSWFYYQPTLDTAWQQFSPGVCLLSTMVEQACDDPDINLVDLGLGAEGYKERFTTALRRTLHFTISSSSLRCVKENVRYHAASAIKSSPRLEHWVRRLTRRPSQGPVNA